MMEEDPGSNVVINSDQSMEIESIFFQSSPMKEAFSLYPEVLIMDATYRLCDNNMPLVVYEVIDCFGAGRIAGYTIIKSEEKCIVSQALKLLCTGDRDAFLRMNIVVVDKDQSEIASIKEVAPHAQIHLCDYHVKDAFERAGKKHHGLKYMDEVHPIVVEMIHAHTEDKFHEAYAELKSVASTAFMNYFNKNWHNSELVWTDYKRNSTFNLKERTTGRVESHNAKIKKLISRKVPVAEVIFKLRTMNRFRDMDLHYKLFLAAAKSKYDKYSKDVVIQSMKKLNTPFVADELVRQYKRSKEPPSRNHHDVTCDSCDCKFYCNTKLPCSHIFRQRSHEGLDVYDHSLVPPRWKLPSTVAISNDTLNEIVVMQNSESVKTSKQIKCLTSEEKYNKCLNICTSISMLMSNSGGIHFDFNLNSLKCLQEHLRKGKKFAIVSVDENLQPEGTILQPLQEDTIDTIHKESEVFIDLSGEEPDANTVVEKLSSTINSQVLQLKLPESVPVKGCPKGNKRKPAWSRKKLPSSDNKPYDEDDPSPLNCPYCKQPALLRTSFSKKNRGKKYYSCNTYKTSKCESYHAWAEDTGHLDNSQFNVIPEGTEEEDDDNVVFVDELNRNERIVKDEVLTPDETVRDGNNASFCIPLGTENVTIRRKRVETSEPSSLIPKNSVQDETCIVCSISGPPVSDGGHKCDMCSTPVHGLDGAPCCSVPVNGSDQEGFGGQGRRCLQCAATASGVKASKRRPQVRASPAGIKTPEQGLQVEASSAVTKICFGCGQNAVLRTSTQIRSLGQQFYTCPNSRVPNCSSKCRWMNWLPWTKKKSTDKKQSTLKNYLGTPKATAVKVLHFNEIGQSRQDDVAGFGDSSLSINDDTCLLALEDLCTFCMNINEEKCDRCTLCKEQVHLTSECSILMPSNGAFPDEAGRICRNCYCKGCQSSKQKGHICKCRVCDRPSTFATCNSCQRFTCATCFNISSDGGKSLCDICKANKDSTVSSLMMKDIVNKEYLSDEHITRASYILQEQFGDTIGGFETPLQVQYGKAVDKDYLYFYPKVKNGQDFVQIFNTGRQHWVTAIIKKGSTTVNILDSNIEAEISGFTRIQAAMLIRTGSSSFNLTRPYCKQQENWYDCGLFAIANAVQYAFSKEVKYVDFDPAVMRDHLLNCLINKRFEEFPKLSSRSKKQKVDESMIVKVYCVCRLPESLSSMIQCDKCKKYFHFLCMDISPSQILANVGWICSQCEDKMLG